MHNFVKWIGAAWLAAGTVGNASAAGIDLSSFVNPANGSAITIGGVSFDLTSYPGGGTGIIQAAYGNPDTYTISVGEALASTIYTVITSAFGSYGSTIGAPAFLGSSGLSYTSDLTEGDNVRDHATTGSNVTASDVSATDPLYLVDVQQIILPPPLDTQTSSGLTLAASENGGGDSVFIAVTALTVSAVPEPSTWAMMLAGFAGLGFAGYRRSKKSGSKFVAA